MLTIHDEQLTQQLRRIAEQENRPIEDVLRTLIAHYPIRDLPVVSDKGNAIKRVRRKAYAKARHYWQSVNELAKAALTDDELDDQFGRFDVEGIPRLKSELESLAPPTGSLAYAAKVARDADIRTGSSIDSSRADDILNEEFAEHLLNRMRGEDAGQ